MEWWTRVRLEVSRGEKSKRGVLRDEGIHWETLKKIMRYSEPPGYRLQEARPKPRIGAYLERIAQIIEEDKALPERLAVLLTWTVNGPILRSYSLT
jgi:hypothetical protein